MNQQYNPDFVRELFDRMSSSYERVNYITSFGFSARWRRQMAEMIPQTRQPVQIIDLLTGMGESWSAIMNRFPNAELTALDFSTGMLVAARAKNKRRFKNRVIITQRNALQSDLPSSSFDIITSSFGLKTFAKEQVRRLAEETYRILKPGGRFSFIEISGPPNRLLYSLYAFYLGRVIPLFGRLLLGNPVEYRMLWKYTLAFGSVSEAADVFSEIGFTVEKRSFFFGCSTGFAGMKPS